MIKDEFTFLSSDEKTNIHVITCIPKNGKYNRVMQIIHGMFEYIERYLPFFEYLTSKGYIVVGHDHIGHGQSINSKEDLGFFGEPNPTDFLIKDIHTLRIKTQQKYKNIPYFICGHSMGSYLLIEYASLHSEDLAGIILLGSGFVSSCKIMFGIMLCNVLSCFKGSHHKSQLIKKICLESGPYKKYDLKKVDLNNSWISRDPEVVKIYNADKKCQFDFTLNGYLGLLQAIQYSCNSSNIAKINKDLPILFISGDCDPVGDNGEGVKQLYEIMKTVGSIDVTIKLYKDARHEVLNEINKNEVYEYISVWLEEKTSIFENNKKKGQ